MGDKEHYVREDVRGFLDMLQQLDRPGVEELPVDEGREGMRMMGSIAEAEPRDLAVVRDLTCPGPAGDIPLRFYDTKENRELGPCVVFLHGGGFVIGDIGVYNSLCTEICHQLDLPTGRTSLKVRMAVRICDELARRQPRTSLNLRMAVRISRSHGRVRRPRPW